MADYLTDEEQAERLKRWWDKNGTSLIVGLALALGGVIGWRYYQDYAAERAAEASSAFASYLAARQAEDPTDEHLAILDEDHVGGSYHVFSLLYRAADQAEQEDWEEALALLERAVELADAGQLRDVARYRAAKVLYQLGRLEASQAQLQQVGGAGLAPQVAELSGDILLAEGKPDAARDAYQSAIDAAKATPGGAPPGVNLMELKLASLVDKTQ